MTLSIVNLWRSIIVGDDKAWVLFEHGTCVILRAPHTNLQAQAVNLLKQWPVQVGTDSADFNVIELAQAPGWVVTCHHPDILTYVGPDELSSDDTSDLLIGLLGRAKRDQDATELVTIHVEEP